MLDHIFSKKMASKLKMKNCIQVVHWIWLLLVCLKDDTIEFERKIKKRKPTSFQPSKILIEVIIRLRDSRIDERIIRAAFRSPVKHP